MSVGGVLLGTPGARLGLASHALVLLCALCLVGQIAEATAVVDVFRMIQYDLGGVPFGSRRSSFSLSPASNASSLPLEELARAIIVMRIPDLDFLLLQEVVDGSKLVGGLLLLLPKSLGFGPSAEPQGASTADAEQALRALSDLERLLINSTLSAPLYFAVEDEGVSKMMEDVRHKEEHGQSASPTAGGYKLQVSQAEGRKMKAPALITLEAWLYGKPKKGEDTAGAPKSTTLPTIAIVAPYDTFGLAPALSVGAGSNGSGVVALLELLRLFSRLYARPRAQPHFNLLFGLTAGGPYDFDGTKQWLASLGPRVLSNVELAICLNTLGGTPGASPKLYLHSSKPLKNPTIVQLMEKLEAGAGLEGLLSVEGVHKKINISDNRVPWEHEVFARQKVVAATVSSLPSAPTAYFQNTGSLADTRLRVDDKAVLAAVKAVAETVVSYMYSPQGTLRGDPSGNAAEARDAEGEGGSPGAGAGAGAGAGVEFFPVGSETGPSAEFVGHWLGFLGEGPRVAPFLTATSDVLQALQDEMTLWASKVEQKKGTLNPHFGIYSGDVAKMYIFEVASMALDFMLLPAVLFYLSLLYVILHICTQGFDDFMSTFRSNPYKKAKAA